MTDNQSVTWTVKSRVKDFAPKEYKRKALESAKYEAGHKIYELLEQIPNPAVVEIREEITPSHKVIPGPYSIYETDDLIQIFIRITPVQYRNIEMPSYLSFDPIIYISKPTFFRRLKYAFTGK